MSICVKCKKRNVCVELCGKARKYANKDYVPQRELSFSDIGVDFSQAFKADHEKPWDQSANHTEEITKFKFLTPLENRLLSMFYLQRKTHKQIARAMSGNNKQKLNRNAVKQRLKRIRAKIRHHFPISKDGKISMDCILNEIYRYCPYCFSEVDSDGWCESCQEHVESLDSYEAQGAIDHEAGAWEYVDNGW